MPNDWEHRMLIDIADVIISNVDKKTKEDETPVRLCNYTDVYYNQFIRRDMAFMSATAKEREIKKCSLFKGDVIITKDSETADDIGVPAYVRESIEGLVCGYHLVILRPKPNVVDGAFLFYALSDRAAQVQFHAKANGITRFGLRKNDIETVEVPIPPLPVQRQIGAILGSLEDKIDLNRRMNRTLERMAQALFKSWFIDFDPVHAKAEGDPTAGGLPEHLAALFPDRFTESDLGPIPEGWEVKSLDEIAHYLNGLACQKHPPVEGRKSLPVIKIRELRQGITANSDRASADVAPKYIVEDGDILFSWSGSLLVTIWCNGRGVLNQHVFKVTSGKYPKWYFYHATKHHLEEFQRIAADKATTMGHIQRHHLSSAKLAVPPDELLNAASEVLGTAIDRRINALKQARSLSLIRDALLPKLLSGDLEVLEAEAAVEEVVG